MTAAGLHRTHPVQPELPLRQPAAEAEPPRDEEWRLDEQTRQIGLRGVALARARLLRSETTGSAGHQGGDRGPTGRAA
jgi:hypothetical protein